MQVEALLDRLEGKPPVMQYIMRQFVELGYGSVAWRVVNSAGGLLFFCGHSWLYALRGAVCCA